MLYWISDGLVAEANVFGDSGLSVYFLTLKLSTLSWSCVLSVGGTHGFCFETTPSWPLCISCTVGCVVDYATMLGSVGLGSD